MITADERLDLSMNKLLIIFYYSQEIYQFIKRSSNTTRPQRYCNLHKYLIGTTENLEKVNHKQPILINGDSFLKKGRFEE